MTINKKGDIAVAFLYIYKSIELIKLSYGFIFFAI